jgi:hypothetical protein
LLKSIDPRCSQGGIVNASILHFPFAIAAPKLPCSGTPLMVRDGSGDGVQYEYRGHGIELVEIDGWSALLIDLETGVLLPTKVIADPGESRGEVARRAHHLIDIYIDGPERARKARSANG